MMNGVKARRDRARRSSTANTSKVRAPETSSSPHSLGDCEAPCPSRALPAVGYLTFAVIRPPWSMQQMSQRSIIRDAIPLQGFNAGVPPVRPAEACSLIITSSSFHL